MRAAVIEKPGKIVLRKMEKPHPEPHEVLIKVKVVGICGSEIAAYRGTHPYRVPPVVSGHELAGNIVALGDEVQGFQIGQKVTVEPQISCGKCIYCKSGSYNLCSSKIVLGTREWPGPLGEYIVAPVESLYKLPEGISYEAGAFVEPLAVGVHAVRMADVRGDDNVLIAGSGSIGLSILGAVRECTDGKIICSDIRSFNLRLADELGADVTVDANRSDFLETIRGIIEGGVDIAFVSVESTSAFEQCFQSVRKKGKIIIVAVFSEKVPVNFWDLLLNEKTMMGTLMYTREDFEKSLNMIASEEFLPQKIITHRFPIEQVGEAFNLVGRGLEEVGKVILAF